MTLTEFRAAAAHGATAVLSVHTGAAYSATVGSFPVALAAWRAAEMLDRHCTIEDAAAAGVAGLAGAPPPKTVDPSSPPARTAPLAPNVMDGSSQAVDRELAASPDSRTSRRPSPADWRGTATPPAATPRLRHPGASVDGLAEDDRVM